MTEGPWSVSRSVLSRRVLLALAVASLALLVEIGNAEEVPLEQAVERAVERLVRSALALVPEGSVRPAACVSSSDWPEPSGARSGGLGIAAGRLGLVCLSQILVGA